MGDAVADAHAAESVGLREGPGHEQVLHVLRQRDHGRIIGIVDKLDVRFVDADDDVLRHRPDRPFQFGGVEDLPGGVVRIADADDTRVFVHGRQHGRQIHLPVPGQRHPFDGLSELLGGPRDGTVGWKSGDRVPRPVPESGQRRRQQDFRRPDPREYRLGVNAVVGREGFLQPVVHGIPVHAEHLARHGLDGPVRGAQRVFVDAELNQQRIVESDAVHGAGRASADHLGGRLPHRRADQRSARAAQHRIAQEIAPVHALSVSHDILRIRWRSVWMHSRGKCASGVMECQSIF